MLRLALMLLVAVGGTACASSPALVASAPSPLLTPRTAEDVPSSSRTSRNALLLGARQLDDDFFYEPVDEPKVIGYEYSHIFTTDASFGLGIEAGAQLAGDSDRVSGLDVTAVFSELSFGVRGRANAGPMEFYAGTGPALVGAAIDIESGPDESDGSLGLYFHTGVLFQIARRFALGLDYRQMFGTDISFKGFVDTDADYSQIALVLSF